MSAENGEKLLPDRCGVVFLIYKGGKVLLEKRTNPDKVYYGYSIIPSGKVKTGETYDQAVRREVREELGVDVMQMYQIDRFLSMTISKHFYDTTAFLITDYDHELRNVEGKSEHVWVGINKALEIIEFGDYKNIIRCAKEFLSERGLLGD